MRVMRTKILPMKVRTATWERDALRRLQLSAFEPASASFAQIRV